jgi:hypothetical protein
MNQEVKTGPEPALKTPETQDRSLAELEAIVQRGKTTALEVADALYEIKSRKLYKPRHWGEYVQERFGFSRQRAHQLMQAKKWLQETSTAVDVPEDITERAIRELCREKKPRAKKTISKIVFDLDAEFQTFLDLVERWDAGLSREDYLQFLERVLNHVENILSEREVAA